MIPPLSQILQSRPPDVIVPSSIMLATRDRLWQEANDTIFAIEKTFPDVDNYTRRAFFRARAALAAARDIMRRQESFAAQNEG